VLTMPQGNVYSDVTAAAAHDALGSNGAWLLLSIDHHGWRARYDLAQALIAGRPDVTTHFGRHVQLMVDLEIQSAIYAATEQVLRLVFACLAHDHGTEAFLDTYVRWTTVAPLIEEAKTVTRGDLDTILEVPATAEEVVGILASHGVEQSFDVAEGLLARVNQLLDELHLNLAEFSQLTQQPAHQEGDNPDLGLRPLRHLDNAFRHGLKAFLPDCLPAARDFGLVGLQDPEVLQSPYLIDLYLSDQEPVFGLIDARPERTGQHLASLRAICIRIKQLSRGFLATRIMGQPGGLLTLQLIDPDELGQDLQ